MVSTAPIAEDSSAADAGRHLRRLVTALGVVQICSWGTLYYSFPLIGEAMRADLGWSKPEIYGAATLGMVLAGAAAFPVGSAIDRGYGRQVMGFGSILAGLLMLVWSQVDRLWMHYAVFAAIGCLQAAMLYEAGFAVIARRTGPADARAGITTMTLWGGFASTIFIPLAQLLIDMFGWRGAVACLGLVNIVVCGGLCLALIDPSRDRVRQPDPAMRPDDRPGRAAVHAAARRPTFWALLVFLVTYFATFSALTYHLYPLLIERGLSVSATVAVMAVIGPAQVGGRVLVWLWFGGTGVRKVGAVAITAFPVAIPCLFYLPADVLLLGATCAVYGAANGILTIVRGMAVPEMLTRSNYGAVNGAMLVPCHIAQAVAPLAAAGLWGAWGSYAAVMAAIVAGAVVMACAFWTAALLSKRDPAKD